MLNSKLIYLETLPCYTNLFLLQVMSILKYLYPVPREDSKRVLTFANHDDYISFRHHTYKKVLKYLIFLEDVLESLLEVVKCTVTQTYI